MLYLEEALRQNWNKFIVIRRSVDHLHNYHYDDKLQYQNMR